MKFSQSLLALCGLLASTGLAVKDDSVVPGAFIVEFDDDNQDPNALYDQLRSEGLSVVPRMDLKYQLFNGASFRIEEQEEEDNTDVLQAKIASSKARVKNVWPVRKIQMPKVDPISVARNGTTGSTEKRASHQKRQETKDDTYSTHVLTQVNKLRAEGITGKGIRIGVVDTGIDYRHPALGGCFGSGCIVEYGYDLTGDDYNEGQEPVPDNDPLDTCQGHGTHVAGIIMAQENELGFTGAAPDVTLGMYKVSGCPGYTTNEILVSGFLRAYEDGSDVISCSAGDDSGWATDASGVAVSRIAEAGVPVVVASGNSGRLGAWQVASPASGISVAGIGSVDNTVLPTLLVRGDFTNETGDYGFGWQTGSPIPQTNVTAKLWAPKNATNLGAYACDSIPSDMPELNDTIVLLRFPTECTVEDQAKNIVARGGKDILFYPETEAKMAGTYVYNEEIQSVGVVSPRQAAEWTKALREGDDIDISITPPDDADAFAENFDIGLNAGLTSEFSSWGPTWEGHLKPQFTTPGGAILSTWTWGSGDYMVNGGTSMATPFAAAVYALVGQVRKTKDATTLRNVISATSKPQKWNDGAIQDMLAPVPQQGAGLVQAYDAAYIKTIPSVSGFSFNDTDNFVGEHTFKLQNEGDEAVTYSLGHEKAVTVYTFEPGSNAVKVATSPPPTAEKWAEINFAKDTITVPAGGSAEVSFTAVAPEGLNATLLPIYSGYITINGDNNETLSIPYLGVAGSMYNTTVVRPVSSGLEGVYLSSTADHFLIPVAANKTFTVPRPGSSGSAVYPKVVAIPTVGTTTLRADVVAVGTTNSSLPTTEWQGYRSLGQIPDYPLKYATTVGYTHNFNGALADKSVIPEGTYKFVISAVRIFGDEKEDEDWDVAETVPFILKYLS